MPITYASVEDAIAGDSLRMVVVGGVPSPWGEAAKGIFHLKGIPWTAVRLAYDSEALKAWAGERSGPIAIYRDEPPRTGWREILELAERLAPAPALLPADPAARAQVLALTASIAGEGGLGWTRRLQLVHGGLTGAAGFPPRVAGYLGKKYGYSAEAGAAAGARVAVQLGELAATLKAQQRDGRRWLVGDALSAADIHAATAMALFRPLPQAHCAMDPRTRAVFETLDAETEAALDPVLLAHRDMVYGQHLELPLSL